MPQWAQLIIGTSALFAACGLLWTKVIKPLARLASDHDQLETRIETLERRVTDLEDER